MENESDKDAKLTPLSGPLRLIYVQPHWLPRKTIQYLLKGAPAEWCFADDERQALALMGKVPGSHDVVLVDHEQTEGSGLRVVRALRTTGYSGSMLAVTVDGLHPIECRRYEAFRVPVFLLLPGTIQTLKAFLFATDSR